MNTLPEDFLNSMRGVIGQEGYDAFLQALSQPSPVSIRVNRDKHIYNGIQPVPWCSSGFYLDHRLTFTFDPLFHAGAYYVQEASSMFLEQAVRQCVTSPVMALDLCAAPGGKSTLLASALPEGSFLVANEVMRNRVSVLAENITKWGRPNVVVTNNDPADFSGMESFFDFILADVPCSGEGMFRKDPDSIGEWSLAGVDVCYQRQRRIINDIWPALKPGGILVYSTCTYNCSEDEDNIAWIVSHLGADVIGLDILEEWGVTSSLKAGFDSPVYRFLPHRTRGEGFFMAVLRKHGERTSRFHVPSPDRKKKERGVRIPAEVYSWIKDDEKYTFSMSDNGISFVPSAYPDAVEYMRSRLRLYKAGTLVALNKGKDWVPQHQLALSVCLNRSAFPSVELSYDDAIAYLRRGSIAVPADVPVGYVLVTYHDIPLGFVKNIGSRSNNLYPVEWRILSSHTPDEVRCLE